MTRFILGLSAAALMVAFTSPTMACQNDHGYKKTADVLRQSTMPTTKEAELMQSLKKSEAAHDKYTLNREFGKMNEAVEAVSEINKQL